MGSNEPLGKPSDIVDILDDGIEVTSDFVDASNLTSKGKTVDKGTPGDSIDTKPMSNLGKRKRYVTDEDVVVFNGMKEDVSDVAAAVRESIHAEAAPGIYNAVINCPGFSREALMYALNHMMEHKATSLVFLDMTPDDRDLWLKTFLAKHYHNRCIPECSNAPDQCSQRSTVLGAPSVLPVHVTVDRPPHPTPPLLPSKLAASSDSFGGEVCRCAQPFQIQPTVAIRRRAATTRAARPAPARKGARTTATGTQGLGDASLFRHRPWLRFPRRRRIESRGRARSVAVPSPTHKAQPKPVSLSAHMTWRPAQGEFQ
uniref:Uncharacterized protein n=1 Tax=Zea mays TaxID=4577 RepID=A0A804LUR2_MAIZE